MFEEGSNAFLRRGASNPSVSADGRFVAFASAEPLAPADSNGNVDVYVRDMGLPEDAPDAFDLVSARDGGGQAATYGPPQVPVPGSDPGADVTRGVAISGDGRYVAFRTEVASDLPASPSVSAGPGQVFVRDRQRTEHDARHSHDPGGGPAGRRSRRCAQRRRHDRRVDGEQRAGPDTLPQGRVGPRRASTTTSGAGWQTVRRRRRAASRESPTPTIRPARQIR